MLVIVNTEPESSWEQCRTSHLLPHIPPQETGHSRRKGLWLVHVCNAHRRTCHTGAQKIPLSPKTVLRDWDCEFYFTEKETEAHGGAETCPKLCGVASEGSGFDSKSLVLSPLPGG